MTISDPLEPLLSDLKKQDGKLWIGISAQYQSEFNEIPFWVLLKDESQLADAISYLQLSLKNIHESQKEDITVSFISKSVNSTYRYGMFKGMDFFRDNASDRLYSPPIESPRSTDIFDYEYPGLPG